MDWPKCLKLSIQGDLGEGRQAKGISKGIVAFWVPVLGDIDLLEEGQLLESVDDGEDLGGKGDLKGSSEAEVVLGIDNDESCFHSSEGNCIYLQVLIDLRLSDFWSILAKNEPSLPQLFYRNISQPTNINIRNQWGSMGINGDRWAPCSHFGQPRAMFPIKCPQTLISNTYIDVLTINLFVFLLTGNHFRHKGCQLLQGVGLYEIFLREVLSRRELTFRALQF